MLIRITIFIAIFGLLCSNFVEAHPFHISTAEIEYNPHSGRLEVSLKLQGSDIEQALTRIAKSKVSLENTVGVDRQIEKYLSEYFFLSIRAEPRADAAGAQTTNDEQRAKSATSGKSRLKWVGKELEASWVWLYFELTPPDDDGELELTNRILLDMTQGQINTCIVRLPDQKHSLRTDLHKPTVPFPREWMRVKGPSE